MSDRVRIPADVDRDDQLLAGLTARQLAILAVTAVALWGLYAATRGLVPLPVFAGLALPVTVVAGMLALGRRDGLPADRLALAWWRQHRAPRRMVQAPEGVEPPPAWLDAAAAEPPPEPLTFPAEGLDADGVVDLGADGAALVCQASSLNFGLRTDTEQHALVAALGRCLNAVTAPVQIVVRAERADLSAAVAELVDAAPALPHPALETAAREHAAFLTSLAGRRDVLRRHVLVVLRDPAPIHAAGPTLARRAQELASGLTAAGVTLTVLGAAAAAAVLARAADPATERPTGLAAPDDLVTGAPR